MKSFRSLLAVILLVAALPSMPSALADHDGYPPPCEMAGPCGPGAMACSYTPFSGQWVCSRVGTEGAAVCQYPAGPPYPTYPLVCAEAGADGVAACKIDGENGRGPTCLAARPDYGVACTPFIGSPIYLDARCIVASVARDVHCWGICLATTVLGRASCDGSNYSWSASDSCAAESRAGDAACGGPYCQAKSVQGDAHCSGYRCHSESTSGNATCEGIECNQPPQPGPLVEVCTLLFCVEVG